jgi:isocitrate dehydrogenase (NAD+)
VVSPLVDEATLTTPPYEKVADPAYNEILYIGPGNSRFMKKHQTVLIPGDGIGPEVTAAVRRVLAAAQAPIEWIEHQAGIVALQAGYDVLPEQTIDAIERAQIALKGPCTTPVGEGFTSVNVQLRKRLNLYAAVRPVRSLEGVPTCFSGVDLIIIRENTEGLYSGIENQVTDDAVMSMKVATRTACLRIAHWAFRFATRRQRRKITVFHKANIMKMTDGLFLRCARQIHQHEYPNIDYQEMIIDAGCMKLVQDPTQFDVLLLENLYGDVVSDLCAGLVGGLGVVPGANFSDHQAVFEAVHGSAPDLAGKGVANPLALLMSAVMMLNHLADTRDDESCRATAERIKAAYDRALEEGQKTRDLGGDLGTEAFADAVIERLT